VALIYSRFNHPNAEILEEQIVPLEAGAEHALVFNSGMSAIMNALLAFLQPGAALVYTVPIYGGTQKLVQAFLEPWGVRGVAVQAGNSRELAGVIRSTPGLGAVLIETPANPTLVMTDIARACEAVAAIDPRPPVLVDNTLLGPAFQHPLEIGADLVLYSATKYLSGFSDLLGGVALARDGGLIARLKLLRNLFGTILQPDECWILNSRLPTVELRMRKAAENALRIAEALAKHPQVARVLHPAHFEDPEQCAIRDAQCEAAGAMLSIELHGGKAAAFDFLRRLRIARNAVSLGGVETLVCHPKTTTHSGASEEEFGATGVTDGLVRISVGIEDWRDLVRDFEQALG
jgi:cystathionine beta-lyase/cystathionine gamma-synthase